MTLLEEIQDKIDWIILKNPVCLSVAFEELKAELQKQVPFIISKKLGNIVTLIDESNIRLLNEVNDCLERYIEFMCQETADINDLITTFKTFLEKHPYKA